MSRGASSWALGEEEVGRINRILQDFLIGSGARCALLVDRTGQMVTSAGEAPQFDAVAFASLAAADFSANDQLAALIGEDEFSSLFHQGERDSMYLADIAKRIILVVIFDKRATLGMIRLRTRSVVGELAQIFRQMFDRQALPGMAPRLENAYIDEAEDEIDRLFGDL